SHVVVLSVDDVELLTGSDDGLNNLLGGLFVPVSSLLGYQSPVLVGSNLLVQSAGTAYLSGRAHNALNVDDLVAVQALRLQPGHSGLAFLSHVGNHGSHVQALISVDGAVVQDDLDAGGLSVLQHGVPAGNVSSGNQQVV